jgi:hypothetical protein
MWHGGRQLPISLALAARWLHLMPRNFGSNEQIFGEE